MRSLLDEASATATAKRSLRSGHLNPHCSEGAASDLADDGRAHVLIPLIHYPFRITPLERHTRDPHDTRIHAASLEQDAHADRHREDRRTDEDSQQMKSLHRLSFVRRPARKSPVLRACSRRSQPRRRRGTIAFSARTSLGVRPITDA